MHLAFSAAPFTFIGELRGSATRGTSDQLVAADCSAESERDEMGTNKPP